MSTRREVEPLRRSSAAHRDSVTEPTAQVVADLREDIGANLLAYIVEKSVSTVNKWAGGSPRPPHEAERVLRTLIQLRGMLGESDGSHVLRAWLIGFNPQLDDDTPADALREGRLRETLAAARAFSIGG